MHRPNRTEPTSLYRFHLVSLLRSVSDIALRDLDVRLEGGRVCFFFAGEDGLHVADMSPMLSVNLDANRISAAVDGFPGSVFAVPDDGITAGAARRASNRVYFSPTPGLFTPPGCIRSGSGS